MIKSDNQHRILDIYIKKLRILSVDNITFA